MKRQKTLMRHLRREREITLDQVHAATGINVSTISRVERGLMTPTDENKKRLARFFRVPADDLLRNSDVFASQVAS